MTKALKISLTVAFGVAVYFFWAIPYRFVLSHQEQFQLFQTTWSYFADHLTWPGGIATWIAEFFTQFYNNYWIGAAIIALLFVALQQSVALQVKSQKSKVKSASAQVKSQKSKVKSLPFALTFVPVFALWLAMGDINMMPTVMWAILLAMLAARGFLCMSNKNMQGIYLLLGIPLLYWAIGPAVFLFAAVVIANYAFSETTLFKKLVFAFFFTAYTVGFVFIGFALNPYPQALQWTGINYFRAMTVHPAAQYIVMGVFVVVAIANKWVSNQKAAASWAWTLGAFAAEWLAFAALFSNCYEAKTYELAEYDYLVRINDWDGIIRKAEKQQPDLPLSVGATNLALAMTNQLGTRAFDFYQNGAEGLISTFKKEVMPTIATGEIYFHLGLINTAQRFAFEGMEAIPNYNKSAREVKRLVETNMLRGNFDVARKYCRMLEHTLFYKKWAKRMEALMSNPAQLATHPYYGPLQEKMLDEEFFFSEMELDKIMGKLYLKNPGNTLAMQYLLMFPLLQGDLAKFMQYAEVVGQYGGVLPPVAQQGVAFAYMKAQQDIPPGIVPQAVVQNLRKFAQAWTNGGKDNPAIEPYKNTLWYYLMTHK